MQNRSCNPEVWGGIECTINRVGDRYRDQLEHANYYDSDANTRAIAAMGFSFVRFPVLWEKHEPEKFGGIDFSWAGRQLAILREADVKPIVGLLHHGSGPLFTDLGDPKFPYLLATYAAKVAIEFPWVEYYTPVNEPLTTARFSGLYGHWYPHQKSNYYFLKILLNQLKGVVLSMQSIRVVNPNAKLVQTEDLCKVHSTEYMRYQADFENERRWLTQDILCGRVDEKHPLWQYLMDSGIDKKELAFFVNNPCPPAINGFNYYVTSERFLDENLSQYPACTHGSNWIDRYADTEAVRVDKRDGVKQLLAEAWNRYALPMALTEVHIGCTVEEQMRWFKETYDACTGLNEKGIDVRGITAWSLLGSYDWNSLLTRIDYHYEPGAFDISGDQIKATELARMTAAYANKESYDHPVLSGKGWWHGPQGLDAIEKNTPPILIVGNNETLGNAFNKACMVRNIHAVNLAGSLSDVNTEVLETLLHDYHAWGVIDVFENDENSEQEDADMHLVELVNRVLDELIEGYLESPFIACDGKAFYHGLILAEKMGQDHAMEMS